MHRRSSMGLFRASVNEHTHAGLSSSACQNITFIHFDLFVSVCHLVVLGTTLRIRTQTCTHVHTNWQIEDTSFCMPFSHQYQRTEKVSRDEAYPQVIVGYLKSLIWHGLINKAGSVGSSPSPTHTHTHPLHTSLCSSHLILQSTQIFTNAALLNVNHNQNKCPESPPTPFIIFLSFLLAIMIKGNN